jgi:hypothetical protein
MTPIPPGELRLWPSHHRSALWWLGLLYRRPRVFRQSLGEAGRRGALTSAAILVLHALPWMFVVAAFGQLVLFGGVGLPLKRPPAEPGLFALILAHIRQIALGIAGGIALGIAVGIGYGIAVGIALGIALGIAVGIAGGIALGIAVGIAFGIATGIALIRAYYLPVHLLFVWPRLRGSSYLCHPVAWDDLCGAPFVGLSRLLAAFADLDRTVSEKEIDRLIDSYPTQRHEALKARAILTAGDAGREADLARLDQRVAGLPEGEQGFLRDVPRLKGMVADIALQQRRLSEVTVPTFREPLAGQLVQEIETFRSRIGGLRSPLAHGFREAAVAWLEVARRQREEARRLVDASPVTEVFRAGDPVDRAREAFVPRMGVIEELQSQATLRLGCPGLLLYGRRRMGKSTLIRNLQPFLPTSVGVTGISMQDPRAFTSLAGLTSRLARVVSEGVPELGPIVDGEDLASLFELLGKADGALQAGGRRLLVAVDEYESIDGKLADGAFSRGLLDMFRESIQHHRQLVWLFAGSHDLSELRHAEWPSYFVSLRTVEVGPFGDVETSVLLTDPLRHSAIFTDDKSRRPRFDLAFWGDKGIERIQAETAGWPHLVQLLAEGVVEIVNMRGLKTATPSLLEEAIGKAVVRGDAVLRQLVENESRLDGEWDYLKGFRAREVQAPPSDEAVYRSLRRRLMVANEGDQWRMRVPLMRRWLIERG